MSLARILIVEDEIIAAQGIRHTLTHLGYDALAIATSGREAMDKVEKLRPDLVLMDIRLKGEMDGIEAAEQIRTRFDIPIVYLTAHADDETLHRAKQTEPSGYLLKPLSTDVLRSTLEMALYKHRAETRLRESEEQYRNLFGRVPMGLYRTTPQGRFLDANPALVRMLGYPERDSLLATNVSDLYETAEDRRRWQAQIEREGEVTNYETRLRRRDGSIIWLSNSAHAVRDAGGKVLYYEGSLEEITERKWAEETLKRRATQLALLNDVGSQIAATLETDEIMGKAVRLIHKTFDYHHVALFILDGERDEMVMRARAGDFDHLFPPEHRIALNQGLVGWTARQGQTAVANDVTADPRYVNFYPDLIPSSAELCAPIWAADSVVGVLDVQSPQRNAFDDNDVLVMETLATQVAVALQNARLHAQVQQELAVRRRAEEALRESARNLALAQEIAHIGSWKYNVESGDLYWSDELFKIYGLNLEDGKSKLDYGIGMIHPDDQDMAAEAFQRAIQDGVPYDINYRIIRPDGQECYVQGIGRIETDEKGRVLNIYGTGQDITKQKRAEKALRASRDGMAMAQEIAGLGNWNWDVSTGKVYWSDQFYRILGFEPGQVEPSAELYWQVIHPDDLAREREASRVALSSPGNSYDIEHRIVRPDGTERIVRSKGKVTSWSKDNRPLLMVGTTQDITDRKQAEEALQRSLQETAHNQRLLMALSQAAQAVQRTRDPEVVYHALSEQASKLGLGATIFTLSEERTHLILSHITLRPGLLRAAEKLTGLSAGGYRFPLTPGGFFRRIIDAGETVFSHLDATPFTEALPRFLHPLAGRLADLCDWQQSIVAPLSIGGTVEGLLVVTGTDLTESDVPAITAFANQAAIAVENARLYTETQQLAAFNESIVQNMAEGIIMADAGGPLTFINPATATLLGYALHELVGQHWTTFVPPDQQPIIQAADERRLRGEADRYELEMVRQDGQRISVLVSGTPRFDADGQFAGTLAVFTDITERKQASEALRESEAFIKAVMDHLPIGVAVNSVDPAVDFTYMNDRFPEFYRTTREAIATPDSFWSAVYEDPAFREEIKKRVLDDCAGDDPEQMYWADIPITREGEETRFITARNTPVPGKPWVISTVWDVTERKRTEESLEQESQLRTALLDNIPDCIALILKKGSREIVASNRFAREIGAVPGRMCYETCAERDDNCPFCLAPTLWETGEPQRLEVKYRGVWYEGIWVSLSDDLYVHYIFDISERKRVEEVIREGEERFRTLTQLAPVGVYLTDALGHCQYVNDRWLEMAGMSVEEALGDGWIKGLHPEDRERIAASWQNMIESRGRWSLEYRFQTPTGKTTWVLGLATALYDERGQTMGYLGTNMDITERRHLEKEREQLYQDLKDRMAELRETQSQLIQSAKLAAVGELAAGVAHELNNPLTSIMGFSNLLLWDAPPDNTMREDLETIVSEANRARTIVRNLLTFARQVESYPENSDLNQVLQETLALVRRHIESDGIEVVEQYAPDLPTLSLDVGRMKQVFLNLINNAHQAMAQGHRLFITSQQEGEELVVRIRDTGRGIPEEHLGQIFEPFFTTKPVGQGTGLGLSVSLGIIHDHDGRIEVESQVGQGSTFTVWLPLQTRRETAKA